MKCLKCGIDISQLLNFDTLLNEFIECPACKHKMTVEYDEYLDEDDDLLEFFWVENYEQPK